MEAPVSCVPGVQRLRRKNQSTKKFSKTYCDYCSHFKKIGKIIILNNEH